MTAAELPDTVPDSQRFHLNGPVMRLALRARGLSNAALAALIDVHPATVSRMLNGAHTTAGVVRRIKAEFPLLDWSEVIMLGELTATLPDGAQDRPVPE